MQTQINWIKYEGRTDELEGGRYLVYGMTINDGKIKHREMRLSSLFGYKTWVDLDSFIIEYIAPLSEVERGIEEVIKQK